MASVFELAKLSEMTYDSTQVAYQHWVRKRYFGSPSGLGFYAEYYYNAKKRDVVLAIRGTDIGGKKPDISDINSDLQISLGHMPSQMAGAQQAYQLIKRLAHDEFRNNYNFYLTGHSLGGGLATLLSAKHGGKPTVTFNAPSVLRSFIGSQIYPIIGSYKLSKMDMRHILHIRAVGDMVSLLTGFNIGRIESIHVPQLGNGKILGASRHVSQHSIINMVQTLRTNYKHLKDLNWTSQA